MPCSGNLKKACSDKIGWLLNQDFQSWKAERISRSAFLVIVNFYDLHFITAATIGFITVHSTFSALFTFGSKQFSRSQFVHAIVKINDDPAADSQVTHQYYGYYYFFHEQCKDNRIYGLLKHLLN